MKFSVVLVLIITYNFFEKTYGEQFDIWGDLGTTNLIIGSSETRHAFPFFKRTIEIKYPDVSKVHLIEKFYNNHWFICAGFSP